MGLYVGTSGYSYKPWKGTFYPKNLPAQQMLGFYGERFRTVEINSTFYGMPKVSTLEGWTRTFRRSPRQFPRIFQRVGPRATPARRSAGRDPGGE